ncbi:MAG: Rossmann-like and DUF2520 domain-containing protein [Muribaculaceae bacterium]
MRIVIIGAGNVAVNLAKALSKHYEIAQIFSRTLTNASQLASAIGCKCTTDRLDEITPDADTYIISVKDDAIASIVEQVPDNGALWLHTSGSVPIDVLSLHRKHCGVLYPMQSFSKQIEVDFAQVPFFVEGCNAQTAHEITALAKSLSLSVYPADSDTRRRLHIAAVFSCNFANHLWALADDVLREANLPFSVMLPLISTTVDKLQQLSPAESQTGPAVRLDHAVISKHLSMLTGDKHNIYDTLTKSIIKKHHKK